MNEWKRNDYSEREHLKCDKYRNYCIRIETNSTRSVGICVGLVRFVLHCPADLLAYTYLNTSTKMDSDVRVRTT